jgi:hypothetical protein
VSHSKASESTGWLFLLNAGAIAIILAYLGGASGRAVGQPVILSPLLKALWPFVTGCVLVAAAGAAGYFNFCYMVASLPSPESATQLPFADSENLANREISTPGRITRRFP